MSADPKTVREIAREIISKQAQYWNAAEIRQGYRTDPRCARLGNKNFTDLRDAVINAIVAATVTVSWPDEQQPADVVTADVPNDLWWPFTGGADVCYVDHGDDGPYRDCCMRAGLAYALKVHEQQVRAGVVAEQQQDGAVGRLTAMLVQLDKFGTDFPYRCEGSRVILGEILSVSVDCENGHGEPVGAGNATGEDLRAVLAERTALAARVAELEGEREADTRAMAAFQLASGQGFRETAAAGWALVERFAERIAALDADTDGGTE